ncbi:hypothetical protein [Flavobacterium sp.]|uniref:hypothetical protein n=1 Tax=Flavobacterium sp. TaxID=239 RepID=UPI004048D8BE
MKIKQLFILSFILICSLKCNNISKEEITKKSKKMEEEILNNQKKYSEKPYYTAKIQAQACYYEIFINEIPIFSFGAAGGISNEIPLNYEILKSGKQILKVRLVPMFNKLQLDKQIDFSINVGFNNIIGEKTLGEYMQTLRFDLPQKIKDAELPFFEIELPFEAKVPWDYSSDFNNAQNLKNNPNVNLLIDNIVKKLHFALLNKDQNTFNSLFINTIKKQCDVMYSSSKEVKEIIDYMQLSKVKSVLPIPEYQIVFYANGKLARVVSKDKDEYGNQYVVKYKVNPLMVGGEEGESSENQIFYLPKGKTELEFF